MCHIYHAECKICSKIIEMHLGDYLTNESEVEVFCNHHLPEVDVVIWKGKDDWYSTSKEEYIVIGNPITVGVRSLTENARVNKDINHPNLVRCDIIEER